MTPAVLTPRQQVAITALVQAGRLVSVAVDLAKAERFLAAATTGLADLTRAGVGLSPRSRHRLAYDAAHDAVESLLAAYGYKTASGPGAHQALAAAVQAILHAPPAAAQAAAAYDALRQQRNADHDRAGVITSSEAARAVQVATLLVGTTSVRLA